MMTALLMHLRCSAGAECCEYPERKEQPISILEEFNIVKRFWVIILQRIISYFGHVVRRNRLKKLIIQGKEVKECKEGWSSIESVF